MGQCPVFSAPSTPCSHLLKGPWDCRGRILMGIAVKDGLVFRHVNSMVQSLASGSAHLPRAGHFQCIHFQSIASFGTYVWIFSLAACPWHLHPSLFCLADVGADMSQAQLGFLEEAVLHAHMDGVCWPPGLLPCLLFYRLKSSWDFKNKRKIQTFLQYFMATDFFC